jgi:hypothetical protein
MRAYADVRNWLTKSIASVAASSSRESTYTAVQKGQPNFVVYFLSLFLCPLFQVSPEALQSFN